MTVHEIYEKVKQLTPKEKEELQALIDDIPEQAKPQSKPRYTLLDLEGMAPYPMCGEDAQAWVTRGREESNTEHVEG